MLNEMDILTFVGRPDVGTNLVGGRTFRRQLYSYGSKKVALLFLVDARFRTYMQAHAKF